MAYNNLPKGGGGISLLPQPGASLIQPTSSSSTWMSAIVGGNSIRSATVAALAVGLAQLARKNKSLSKILSKKSFYAFILVFLATSLSPIVMQYLPGGIVPPLVMRSLVTGALAALGAKFVLGDKSPLKTLLIAAGAELATSYVISP